MKTEEWKRIKDRKGVKGRQRKKRREEQRKMVDNKTDKIVFIKKNINIVLFYIIKQCTIIH